MKVAVSIPDRLFARAEALAKRMNVSRSRIFAQALDAYVDHHGVGNLTDAANEVADALALDTIAADDVAALTRAGSRTAAMYSEW